MGDLYSRAVAFFNGPRIISDPGRSLSGLIRRYVDGEPWDDPELREQLSRGVLTAQTAAMECDGTTWPGRDAQHFYRTAAQILQDIQAEVLAGRG